ncbi:MAG TPA: PAS domain S-box protein, partial [Cellvibrionaceae bacterium]
MKGKLPSFSQSISFQLAKIGIVVAFVLSFLMNSIQMYIDYQAQLRDLDSLIERVAEVATPPAARAVHTLDSTLAAEVAYGLLRYDFIYQVRILDERGNVLAEADKPRPPLNNSWLTKLTADDTRIYTGALQVPGYAVGESGTIAFSVDLHAALAGFYNRSEINMVVGILRNLLLVLILFIAFYITLTKPLVRLASEVNTINPDQPGVQRLTALSDRRHDELATVISSTNMLLDVVELSLAKRRAVELALRKSEEHLRQIIDSLPVMIGARNIDGFYLFANKSLAETLGFSQDQMRNVHVRQLLKNSVIDVDKVLLNDTRVIRDGEEIDVIEESFIGADGTQLYLQTH